MALFDDGTGVGGRPPEVNAAAAASVPSGACPTVLRRRLRLTARPGGRITVRDADGIPADPEHNPPAPARTPFRAPG